MINHVGISGGKDSTALLLWAVHESGYPHESIRASFCDTGNENPLTLAYVDMLSEKVFPVEILRPEKPFFELARSRGRFPSAKARFCTQQLKMQPTQAHVFKLASDGATVLLHSGVRAAESTERAKLPEREWDGYFAMEVFRPLLRWSLADVWAIHKRYGIAPNPLYGMGSQRVGCYPCVMSRKEELRNIVNRFPEVIDRIRDAETSIGKQGSTFFPRKMVPEQFRSREVTTKKGERVKVGTIDDVAVWSKTVWGGKQFALPLTFEYDWQDDDLHSCPSALGQCE